MIKLSKSKPLTHNFSFVCLSCLKTTTPKKFSGIRFTINGREVNAPESLEGVRHKECGSTDIAYAYDTKDPYLTYAAMIIIFFVGFAFGFSIAAI